MLENVNIEKKASPRQLYLRGSMAYKSYETGFVKTRTSPHFYNNYLKRVPLGEIFQSTKKYPQVEDVDLLAGVELNVGDKPIHRTGKSRKLPFLSKNCNS